MLSSRPITNPPGFSQGTNLGTMVNDLVDIVGGEIDGTDIGSRVPAYGNYTELYLNGLPVGSSSALGANIRDWAHLGGDPTDTGMMQNAITYALTNRITLFFDGDLTIEDEMSFVGQTVPFAIRGMNRETSRLLVPPIGSALKLFKMPNTSNSDRPSTNNYFSDFTIWGITGSGDDGLDRDHPIGIYIPFSRNDRLEQVRVVYLGNTPFWLSAVDNLRMLYCRAISCGFAVSEDDAVSVDNTYTTTLNSNVLTCNTGSPFSSDHEGRNIYVYNTSGNNLPSARTIVSQTGSTATMDRPFYLNNSAAYAGMEIVKGAISAASTTLTSEQDMFVVGDEGRYIYVEGAGLYGGVLTTTIATYTDAHTVTLADPAEFDVTSGFIHLTPTLAVVNTREDDVQRNNDVSLDHFWCENNRGPGVLLSGGIGFNITNTKVHGLYGGELFSLFSRNYILDSLRTARISGGEWVGGDTKDSGNIYICGGQADIIIEGAETQRMCEGQSVIHLDSTDTATRLRFGNLSLGRASTDTSSVVLLGSSMTSANVIPLGWNTLRYSQTSSWSANEYYIKHAAQLRGDDVDRAFTTAALSSGTPLPAGRLDLYDALRDELVSQGINLDFLLIHAAHDEVAALVNILDARYHSASLGNSNLVFTTDVGFTGDSTGWQQYVEVDFIPSGSTYYQQDDCCFGVWSLTAGASLGTSNYDMGSRPTASPQASVRLRASTGNLTYTINDGTLGSIASSDGSGFFNIIRTGATARNVRWNNGLFGSGTTASTGVPDANFQVLAVNGNGSTSNRTIAASWAGASMDSTQSDAFYTALQTYLTAVGAI